ncbi:MAG: DUF2892 domain-containing protein [Gammaproteobacteria bacterium]|nr:DUF2892 domain-containing protein [Gammaproteobacteria bacterium]MDE0302408.1 DUF2892 domain-containing protein [Gammaproteobacteria bacterium]MDE0611504.1 DUF2892 domain-containing protein [Gammaproteobacteria bacterium]
MTVNVHIVERVLRVVAGVVILYVGLEMYDAAWWAWLGLIPLVTGLVGNCPVYKIFGISSK